MSQSREDAFEMVCEMLGLDEFQRIAVAALFAEIEASGGVDEVEPGTRTWDLFYSLGAIAGEALGFPRPPLDDHEGEA